MDIRKAVAGDLQRMWELDRICFEPGIAYSPTEMRRFFELPGALALVVERDGQIEGFALGYADRRGAAHVVTLDVRPSGRRRGLGRRLLERLLSGFVAAGARRAVLEVDVRNSGAVAFYRELGFRKSGRIRSYYGPGLDAFEMTRALRPARRSPAGTDAG